MKKTFTHMSNHVHDFIEFKERRWCYLLFLKNKKTKSPKLYFKVNKKDLNLVFHFHISNVFLIVFILKHMFSKDNVKLRRLIQK